jgi:uncharacterized repeat protein (TIGR01451 family)
VVLTGAITEESLALTGLSPVKAPNSGVLTDAVITGSGFAVNPQVALVRGAQTITGVVQSVDTSLDRITADFDLTGAQPGLWSVRVANTPSDSVLFPDALYITDAGLPDLAVVTGSGSDVVEPGSLLTFTIGIRNTGWVTATGVVFTDTLPQHVTFESLTPACAGGTVALPGGFACSIAGASLTGGQSTTYTLVVAVDQDATGALLQRVVVASQERDAYIIDNSSDVTVYLKGVANYLPLVVRGWPPLPATPVLAPINNADQDGDYLVDWSDANRATGYTLQEATVASFSAASVVFNGAQSALAVSGQSPQTYYYRVKALNAYGDSAWSNVQSVLVAPDLPERLADVADADILQGRPDQNYGGNDEMWVGYDDYLEPDGRIARSFIRFDTSAMPAGTSIGRATLYLYLNSSYDFPDRSRTLMVYRVTSSWTESGLTWNTQPSIGEAYGSALVTHGDWGWYAFDITGLVRGWLNGTWSNHGLVVRGPEHSGEDSSWKSFFTREEATYAPYISITYAADKGIEGQEPADGDDSQGDAGGSDDVSTRRLERVNAP